ncbi:MAG: GNAT family N-acetyltransferase [Acholeplasmatales bacterium]|nr:MAG: GNAT family N-acetyltransferase [Acholeplasmatales bacterium]
MTIEDVILEQEKEAVKCFLHQHNLSYDEDIDESIVLREDGKIIGTASVSGNILKCVAVDSEYQGENLLATLISALLQRLRQRDVHHVFVYTIDDHVARFKALGFKPIVQTMTTALLELGGSIQEALLNLKRSHALSDAPKGCVVVNANPMTLGHVHLIKTAAEHHAETLVFVVSEDRSIFPFAARFAMVTEACRAIPGVTVLPSLDYLVSSATFPKYFLKSESKIREEHALIDVLTFKTYYMKAFNISHRYMGEEPFSPMTSVYNETMKKYLNNQCHIVPRLKLGEHPISASTVRKLLRHHGLTEAISPYVPDATVAYLNSPEGETIIRRLKHHEQRH